MIHLDINKIDLDNGNYWSAKEFAEAMNISMSFAYRIMSQSNMSFVAHYGKRKFIVKKLLYKAMMESAETGEELH